MTTLARQRLGLLHRLLALQGELIETKGHWSAVRCPLLFALVRGPPSAIVRREALALPPSHAAAQSRYGQRTTDNGRPSLLLFKLDVDDILGLGAGGAVVGRG